MEHKRLTLFAGHYGTGKTNIAVNYALELKKLEKKVCIADLDIVNPYFRTKDSEEELKKAGVDLISPLYANSNVDLPALPAEAYRLVEDKSTYGVIDIGGDDQGAYALGRFTPFIKKENNYRMVFVVNCYRPLTSTPEDALEIMREIEDACRLKFTDIVNNSNLGNETTAETFYDSMKFMEKLEGLSGLNVYMNTVKEDLAEEVGKKCDNVLPLKLQKKYFDLPTDIVI